VSDSTTLVTTTTTILSAASSSFDLNSSTAGGGLVAGSTYYMSIRPSVGTIWYADGPLKLVVPQSSPRLRKDVSVKLVKGEESLRGSC
jgi:hypothetical protein